MFFRRFDEQTKHLAKLYRYLQRPETDGPHGGEVGRYTESRDSTSRYANNNNNDNNEGGGHYTASHDGIHQEGVYSNPNNFPTEVNIINIFNI